MEKEVIYKIVSPKSKLYIGRTNNFQGRLAQHKHNALIKNKKNSLYKAIRKYGWDNMIKEIICEVDSKDAQRIEEEFILAYNSVRKGYNDTFSGGGGNLWKGRLDTNEYMEFVEKMKKAGTGEKNGMFGKTHSDETKQKQKEKAKGRYSLDWFKARYGDSEGEIKYEERKLWLRNRNLKKDELGRFIKAK
jgi:group I intron endonuclease